MAEPDSNATDFAGSGSVSNSECVGPLTPGNAGALARIERKANTIFSKSSNDEGVGRVVHRFAGEGAGVPSIKSCPSPQIEPLTTCGVSSGKEL
jgi:hypothetical protein